MVLGFQQRKSFTSARNIQRLAMEIASNSRVLHLFQTEQRYKLNRVGCNRNYFSKTSSRNCRNRNKEEEKRFDVIPASKKRNKFCEEEDVTSNKRQKKTVIEHNSTSKAKSVSTSLGVTTLRSKFTKRLPSIRCHEEIKTKQVEEDSPNKRQKKTVIEHNSTSKAKSVSTSLGVTTSRSKFTKRLPSIRRHEEIKTKQVEEETKNQGRCSLRDLVEKAKNKVEEKRKIDARREYIARLRLEARLAINRIEQTVVVADDDHLKYHRELENLGCTFIHEQVSLLTKFSLREH